MRRERIVKVMAIAAMLVLVMATAGWCGSGGGDAPWLSGLEKAVEWITGKTAKLIAVGFTCIAAAGWMTSEGGSGWNKAFKILLCVGVMLTATTCVDLLFSSASGLSMLR